MPTTSYCLPVSVCFSRNRATSSSASRSLPTCTATSGRCTLTATGVPSRSVARCTCPSEAAARGFSSNVAKAFDSRTPRSASMIACTSGNGNGLTLSCSRVSASMYARRHAGPAATTAPARVLRTLGQALPDRAPAVQVPRRRLRACVTSVGNAPGVVGPAFERPYFRNKVGDGGVTAQFVGQHLHTSSVCNWCAHFKPRYMIEPLRWCLL